MCKNKRNNRGFSLVELIVVILIIAIISVALAPQVVKYVSKSKESVCMNNRAQIKKAITLYNTELDRGGYPGVDMRPYEKTTAKFAEFLETYKISETYFGTKTDELSCPSGPNNYYFEVNYPAYKICCLAHGDVGGVKDGGSGPSLAEFNPMKPLSDLFDTVANGKQNTASKIGLNKNICNSTCPGNNSKIIGINKLIEECASQIKNKKADEKNQDELAFVDLYNNGYMKTWVTIPVVSDDNKKQNVIVWTNQDISTKYNVNELDVIKNTMSTEEIKPIVERAPKVPVMMYDPNGTLTVGYAPVTKAADQSSPYAFISGPLVVDKTGASAGNYSNPGSMIVDEGKKQFTSFSEAKLYYDSLEPIAKK